MGVQVQTEQVPKFRNLRNSVVCENSQPHEISSVVQFPSIYGSNFYPTYDTHLRVGLGFFMYESSR